MRRAAAIGALAAALVFGASACHAILGIDYPPERSDGGALGSDGGGATAEASTDTGAPIAASCRGIKAAQPGAASGTYALTGQDGGFYCDMESMDGGWTLVRPDMLTEGTTKEADPTSPNTIDVARATDPHGGAAWNAEVTHDDCNASGKARALHWILVNELDDWTHIMATYTFVEGTQCWHIFGNDTEDRQWLPAMNMKPFDPLQDLVDREANMARDADGGVIPYDGKTGFCGPEKANFWSTAYRADTRSARVVLRRDRPQKPAGLFVSTACGLPGWTLGEVFVR